MIHDVTQFIYRVKKCKALTENILQVFLEPESLALHYQAGQYLEVLYPNNTFQPFSIANAPTLNNQIELHIRHLNTDLPTAAMVKELKKNETVVLRGPLGNAYYRKTPTKPILILAGGTGFAYAKAIIEKAIAEKDPRIFHLYWSVKRSSDFYLPDLPKLWQRQLKNFRYTPMISQLHADNSWAGAVGYIQQTVLKDYPDLSELQIYASGPLAMITTAYEIFLHNGLPQNAMYSDMLA